MAITYQLLSLFLRSLERGRVSELGLAQSEIAFWQQIQHKRTVTSGTVTINC
jgi:hypothetical protein